jgi:membrane protein
MRHRFAVAGVEDRGRENTPDTTDTATTSQSWVFRLGGLSVWQLIKRVFKESRGDDVLGHSAQLSYYFLLAFFPLMIFACSSVGSVLGRQSELSNSILDYMRPVVPNPGFALLQSTVKDVVSTNHIHVFSLCFALWSGSYGIEAVISGLNAVFDVRESRPWWKRRLLALAMAAVLAIASVLAMALVIWGRGVGRLLASHFGEAWLFDAAWPFVRWALALVFLFAAVTLIYKFGPNLRKQPLISVLPGAALGILLWIAASLGFRLYIARSFASYQSFYGSLGAIVALLVWLYLTSASLLVGAEVNSEIRWAAKDAGEPGARDALRGGSPDDEDGDQRFSKRTG